MSEENVELGTAAMEAFVRGDLPALLRCMDPEVRFEPQIAELQGGYIGHDGIRAFMAEVLEAFADVYTAEFLEIRDLGDQTLSFGSFRLGGRESGIDAEVPFAIVTTYREGLITHLKDYGGDKQQALEAVGLAQ
jgi:ketosteroid isomerase-like protein